MGGMALKHIMLVEDDAAIRETVRVVLAEKGGFNLTVCASGEEALKQIVEVKPQLILLDVIMPEMDGMETFTKLQEIAEGRRIPVIFLTSRVKHSQIERYSQMGALGTIAKPFDPNTLAANVKRLWSIYESKDMAYWKRLKD